MKGHILIKIPVKPYVAAYLLNRFNGKIILTEMDFCGRKVYDLLRQERNTNRNKYRSDSYPLYISVQIPTKWFLKRGGILNENSVRSFNLFMESYIKSHFYYMMDLLFDEEPAFKKHLPKVREKLGIDIEYWSDDSMQKCYYRYRKDHVNNRLIYNKTGTNVSFSKSAQMLKNTPIVNTPIQIDIIMKSAIHDIQSIRKNYKPGICKIYCTPLENIKSYSAAPNRNITEILLNEGQSWITLNCIPESYKYSDEPKESNGNKYHSISIKGTTGDSSPDSVMTLDILCKIPLIVLVQDTDGDIRVLGPIYKSKKGADLNYELTNESGNSKYIDITITQATDRAPAIYTGDMDF